MAIDGFYQSSLGAVVVGLVTRRLAEFWPSGALAGQTLLGYGHTSPYMGNWRGIAYRTIDMRPAHSSDRLAFVGGGAFCLTGEGSLPLADLSIDRVLLVHGLEAAENARRLLREFWRVLKDDGRLLMVVPNRHGIWAHLENTPFGQGQPYTPGQIGRLMAEAMFRVERRDTALFVPPGEHRMLHHAALVCEKFGRGVLPSLGGVTISEAIKDVYAALPETPSSRRRVVLAEVAYCRN